jgi:hypothetical protein
MKNKRFEETAGDFSIESARELSRTCLDQAQKNRRLLQAIRHGDFVRELGRLLLTGVGA